MRMMDRRTVLKGALAGLAAAGLAPGARRAFAQAEPAIADLGHDLAVISGVGGNVLVLAATSGQVLVDSGAAEHGEALGAALKKLPGAARVQTLFNTHWHLDQVGSNERIGRSGAAIIAHEKTRLHLAAGYYLPEEDRYEPPQPKEAQPTQSFYTDGSATIADRPIDYGYLLEAHTDGDIYVHFRDANVLAVGDAVSPVRDPELDWFGGGWLGGRVDSLKRLLDVSDAGTRFVPGYGPVIGRAEVEAEHAMMLKLFERMVELVRKGDSPEDIVAAGVMDDLGRKFDDPLKFVYAAHKSLWAHHNTLSPDIV
jgi:cyclase